MSHRKAQKRGQAPSPCSTSPASSETLGPQEQQLTRPLPPPKILLLKPSTSDTNRLHPERGEALERKVP